MKLLSWSIDAAIAPRVKGRVFEKAFDLDRPVYVRGDAIGNLMSVLITLACLLLLAPLCYALVFVAAYAYVIYLL